jgi:hypothetical protein
MSDARPNKSCVLCAKLHDAEYAIQIGGRESEDIFLPTEAYQLDEVKDLNPSGGRTEHLKRCPICATYYLYTTTYEYLVYGSEDEQFLTRLSDEEAARYLQQV